jgi:hypothetical protein
MSENLRLMTEAAAFAAIDEQTIRGALIALSGAVIGGLTTAIPAALSVRSTRRAASAAVRRAEKFAGYEDAFGHVIESADLAIHLCSNLRSARERNTDEQFSNWQRSEFPRYKVVSDAMSASRQRLRIVASPRVLGLYDAHIGLFEPLANRLYDGDLGDDFAILRSGLIDDSLDALGFAIRQDLGYTE